MRNIQSTLEKSFSFQKSCRAVLSIKRFAISSFVVIVAVSIVAVAVAAFDVFFQFVEFMICLLFFVACFWM